MLEETFEKPLDPGRTCRILNFTVQFFNSTKRASSNTNPSISPIRTTGKLFAMTFFKVLHLRLPSTLRVNNFIENHQCNLWISKKLSNHLQDQFRFPLLIHTQPSCFVIEFSEAMTRNGLTWITKHTLCQPTLLDTILRGHSTHTQTHMASRFQSRTFPFVSRL